jgi:aminomethyltransferase
MLDDLMITRREDDLFLVVNAGCKDADIATCITHIGHRCQVCPCPTARCWRCRARKAVTALARLNPGVAALTFMTGGGSPGRRDCFVTRSGYTGEDGFEISVPADQAVALAASCWPSPRSSPPAWARATRCAWKPACACTATTSTTTTTPVEAGLTWAIQKVRRPGGGARRRLPGRRPSTASWPAARPQARRPGRPGARAGARRRGLVDAHGHRWAGHQRHAGPDGEPAHRDGLPGRQPRRACSTRCTPRCAASACRCA